MDQFLKHSDIRAADTFESTKFPQLDREIGLIKMQLNSRGDKDQAAVVISYCRDHSVRVDLARAQAPLVKFLLSTNTCRCIEDLFMASKDNERFRSGLENYLIAKFA